MSRHLLSPLAVGLVLGIPMLLLQRSVAETRSAAIALVTAWMLVVAVALAIYVRRRPEFRVPVLGTWLAVVVGTLAIGYVTGFRDMRVDEQVAMAATRASAAERERGLAAQTAEPASRPRMRRSRVVELARGTFAGADGHAGTGRATVVAQPDGRRLLTFTRFDVDPDVDVDVYLTASPDSVDDRIELGDLKGNIGDQQYEIPARANLGRYPNGILWCKPFTVRIAVATLGIS